MRSIISRFKTSGAANPTGGTVRPSFPQWKPKTTTVLGAGAGAGAIGTVAITESPEQAKIVLMGIVALVLILILGD